MCRVKIEAEQALAHSCSHKPMKAINSIIKQWNQEKFFTEESSTFKILWHQYPKLNGEWPESRYWGCMISGILTRNPDNFFTLKLVHYRSRGHKPHSTWRCVCLYVYVGHWAKMGFFTWITDLEQCPFSQGASICWSRLAEFWMCGVYKNGHGAQ